ncbi:hypothetical protein [Pseudomonas helleri]|uniref:hypothetical protein n=1 Tax=Pseudomonas helleri TaxID=1608996 RepID=UPI0030DA8B75
MSNSQPFTSTPPQGTVPAFKAYTVAYRRTETPFVSPQVSPEDAALALGQRVGDEACRYASDAGPIDDYVVSSTVLSQFLADGSPHAGIFQEAIATRYGRRPDWVTNAYECTGWGFILRYIQSKAQLTGRRRLLLQIVDTDIHNFTYWLGNNRWGKSGFGICTLVIDVMPEPKNMLLIGTASQANALLQLGRNLRSFTESRSGLGIAVPFFPEMSRRALFKCFDTSSVHGDHYQRFGHSFGSDPWLSLLGELGAGTAHTGSDCIVSSLAMNGYFSIAQITLAPDLHYALEGEM